MKFDFDHKQFDDDVESVKKLFVGFLKSLGPKQKKMGEVPVGTLEEQHIRFRLSLVEMGISKIIRICLVILFGILLYALVFRNSDGFFKIITVLIFISFLAWMLLDHLKESAKDGSRVAGALVSFHGHRESIQETTFGFISSIFKSIEEGIKGLGRSIQGIFKKSE